MSCCKAFKEALQIFRKALFTFIQLSQGQGQAAGSKGFICLHFLMDEQLRIIGKICNEEIQLGRDFCQDFHPLLEQICNFPGVKSIPKSLSDIWRCSLMKILGGHLADLFPIHPAKLLLVEDCRGFGDSGNIKGLFQFFQGEELPVASRTPA